MPKASKKQLTEKLESPTDMGEIPSTVYLPVTAAQIKGLSVGDKVEIAVKGKARSISQYKDHSSLDVDIDTLEVYPENEFSQLAEDD